MPICHGSYLGQLNGQLLTQVSNIGIITVQLKYQTLLLYTFSERFPISVELAVKSNLTSWCDQNLPERDLNALTVLALTTEFGRLFQILAIRAEKKCLHKS